MSVIWITRNQMIDLNERYKTMSHNQSWTCDFCNDPINELSKFDHNGKILHWKCVRAIVHERLQSADELNQFAERMNESAEEFAKKLGFQTYDEYHKQTYGY